MEKTYDRLLVDEESANYIRFSAAEEDRPYLSFVRGLVKEHQRRNPRHFRKWKIHKGLAGKKTA